MCFNHFVGKSLITPKIHNLKNYIGHYRTNIFRKPLNIGKMWVFLNFLNINEFKQIINKDNINMLNNSEVTQIYANASSYE
jgi:hypothetical protein